MNKTVYTLNVRMEYSPDICHLTYPLIKAYASKIGADFQIISDRKFPGWPITYEKLQIYDLGKHNDWNIYIDSDAIIHPDMFDVTDLLRRDTVCHHGSDMAGNRWRYDEYFRRDGRHIGSCNWFTVASDWCLDLWRPLDDLSLDEALANIFPIHNELTCPARIRAEHLIDDYVLSRNIARFGLKFTRVLDMIQSIAHGDYFRHFYTEGFEDYVTDLPVTGVWPKDHYLKGGKLVRKGKITLLKETMKGWGIEAVPVETSHEEWLDRLMSSDQLMLA